MRFPPLLSFLLAVKYVAARPHHVRSNPVVGTCGTPLPDGFADISSGLANIEANGGMMIDSVTKFTIQAFVHVVVAVEGSTNATDGYLSVSYLPKCYTCRS